MKSKKPQDIIKVMFPDTCKKTRTIIGGGENEENNRLIVEGNWGGGGGGKNFNPRVAETGKKFKGRRKTAMKDARISMKLFNSDCGHARNDVHHDLEKWVYSSCKKPYYHTLWLSTTGTLRHLGGRGKGVK